MHKIYYLTRTHYDFDLSENLELFNEDNVIVFYNIKKHIKPFDPYDVLRVSPILEKNSEVIIFKTEKGYTIYKDNIEGLTHYDCAFQVIEDIGDLAEISYSDTRDDTVYI